MANTESLQERQARIALITTPAMKILAKLTNPDVLATVQVALEREGTALSVEDAALLKKHRGKFAGIFTRIAYQADNRGIVATPEDLVLGAVSSLFASRDVGGEIHGELAKLAKHWTRKVAGSSTPVSLHISTLRSLTGASAFWGCLLKAESAAATQAKKAPATGAAAEEGVTSAPRAEVAAHVEPNGAEVTIAEVTIEALAAKPGEENVGVLSRRR